MTGVIRRQGQQVSLVLSSPSVEDAIAAVQARRGQAAREGLRVKAADDGLLTARIPGGRYSSPPRLKGFLRAGAGGVEFDGVISEAHASVGLPRGFVGMAAIFAVVTVLLAFGNPDPGSYVCGAGAVLFGLIGRRRPQSGVGQCVRRVANRVTHHALHCWAGEGCETCRMAGRVPRRGIWRCSARGPCSR